MKCRIALLFVATCVPLLSHCSGPSPASTDASAPTPTVPRLSNEELTTLFLDNAKVWKFVSNPGVPVKSVRFQFIENGKPTTSGGSSSPTARVITKLIVVVQEYEDKHVLKIYEDFEDGTLHGKIMDSNTAWFVTPLTYSDAVIQTETGPIVPGTITLLSGGSEIPASGRSATFSSATDPCRLELVIE